MGRISALLAVLALLTAGSAAAQSPMKTFSPPGGYFTVQMPGTPQSATESIKQTNGDTTVSNRFWVSTDNGNVAYMLLYNDDPRSQGSPQRRLEAARDGALKAGPATLVTSRAVTMDGIPGLAYTGRIDKDGSTADVLDYYNGRRLYQLLVIATAGVTARYRDAYFKSFRILAQR